MSRIEVKDGGKVSPKEKEKERKDLVKHLELSVLCKQAKDSGLDEVEEKEKDAEKEKVRKEVKVRKEKERVKAKERKEKENVLEGQFAVSVTRKDIGGMNAPTDIQYETWKPKNNTQVQKPMHTTHRIRTSIQGRMF